MPEILIRFVGWCVHKIGVQTLLAFILLLVIFGSVAASLADMTRELDTEFLTYITLGALLSGWLLAKSPLKGWQAGFLATLLGIIITIIYTGKLGAKLAALAVVIGQLAWEFYLRSPYDPYPNLSPSIILLQDLGQNLATLQARVTHWTQALINGTPVYDLMAAALVWGLAMWAIAAWAGWAVRRRQQPLAAVLPACVLLTVSLSLTKSNVQYLIPVLGATFLLLALTSINVNQLRWRRTNTDYAEDIYFDMGMWSLAFVIGVLTVATSISFISPQKIFHSVQRVIQERGIDTRPINEPLGLEPPSAYEAGKAGVGSRGLPRDHLLGSGPELSLQTAMIISVQDPLFDPPGTSQGGSIPPYYWRSLTYDIYTGSGWATSSTELVQYRADDLATAAELPSHRLVWQNVQMVGDLGNRLHAAGSLVTVNQDYEVDWRSVPDGVSDAFGITLNTTEESYRAASHQPLVGEVQLRAAGSDYPEWVLERYLPLPEEVPTQVIDLARGLTANAITPYDKARAIEDYLRDFPYSLEVPSPPPDRDVAAFFLFDLQEGYCDYYATAMVVMARAVGLPARLVMGYARGSYDPNQMHFVITEADAHSWVDIYFPGIGWVEFEPTGGRPAIERMTDISTLDISNLARDIEMPTQHFHLRLSDWLKRAMLIGAFLGFVLLTWSLSDAWRLRHLSPLRTLTSLYRRLYHYGKRLDIRSQPGDTPYDIAALLSNLVMNLASDKRWHKSLTPASQEAGELIDQYARAIYSPHPPDSAGQSRAIQTWRRLRWRLWLAQVIRMVKRTRPKSGTQSATETK